MTQLWKSLPLALLLCAAVPVIRAQAPAGSLTIVTHVDILPDSSKPQAEEHAATLLRAERDATAHDAGLLSFTLLQQNGAPNHFTLVESWHDLHAYELHQGSAHTIAFRNGIQPLLGSPFDARVHHVFQ